MDRLEALLEKKHPKKELFYNKSDKMLDMGGFQIPLMFVEYRYIENEGAFLRIEFTNKADVYEAINLMDAIKRD